MCNYIKRSSSFFEMLDHRNWYNVYLLHSIGLDSSFTFAVQKSMPSLHLGKEFYFYFGWTTNQTGKETGYIYA